MKNTLETRLGIFVALAVLAAVLIIEVVGGPGKFERGYELVAMFSNVQDLKEGDRVKMAGVEVGRVENISLDQTNNKVVVTMKLRQKVHGRPVVVRTDSVATIKFTGLMGQNFVAIDFGTPAAPLAKPNSVLTTTEQADFGAILAKLEGVADGVKNLTKTFTGAKLDNLIGPLIDFIEANKGPLTAAIANLQAASGQLAPGKGTVGRLLYEDALYTSALAAVTNLEDTASQVKLTIADARKAVDQINAGQGTVGKLLHDEALYRETTESMATLKEILQKINQGQGTVGKVINDEALYKNAKLTLQKLDKATEGLEDQGPLSILGTVVGKLF
jgi:phospholipid/cholesterol/gamma-HCH transport system substrate-binding protein